MKEKTLEKKQGYKKTKLGWIPVEWEVVRLESISKKVMVGIASAATHAYRESGIPMFRNQNIKEEGLDDSDLLYIDEEYEKSHKNKRLKNGDILTVRTGYPGISAVVPEKYEGAQCFTSLITRPDFEFIHSQWLAFFINSPLGKRLMLGAEAGGAQKNINAGILSKLWIPKVSLPEQQKIATILTTWDKAIEHVKLLTENLELRKKGLMRRLLMGKLRLKGFGGEWEEVELRDILTNIIGGGTPSKRNLKFWNGEIPWASVKDITNFNAHSTTDYITKAGLENSSSKLIAAGTLITSTRMALGKAVIFNCAVAINQDLKALFHDEKKVILKFLKYWFELNEQNIERLGSGSTVKGITLSTLKKCRVYLPPLLEQTAIAAILTKSDEEIALYRQKLTALQEQKKGLMQQLLTGKIRVKI